MSLLRIKWLNCPATSQTLIGRVSYSGFSSTSKTITERRSTVICHSNSTPVDHFTKISSFPSFTLDKRFYSKPSEIKDLLNHDERVSVHEYKKIVDSGVKHLLIDVRPPDDVASAKLDQAVNLPLKQLLSEQGLQQFIKLSNEMNHNGGQVYVMCRKGISSQIAVKYLKDKLPYSEKFMIKDIIGGITAWSKEIDSSIKLD